MTGNAIAKEIVDATFRIHTTLGPGLLDPFIKPSWRMSWAAGVSARSASSRFAAYENVRIALIKKDGITRIVSGLQDDHAKSPSREEAQQYLVSASFPWDFNGQPWLWLRLNL